MAKRDGGDTVATVQRKAKTAYDALKALLNGEDLKSKRQKGADIQEMRKALLWALKQTVWVNFTQPPPYVVKNYGDAPNSERCPRIIVDAIFGKEDNEQDKP